jgi:hypothetical protein
MDDPAEDLQAKVPGEQQPADNRTIVRRTEVTVEREITTVILRRRDEFSEPRLSSKPPVDNDDSI